MQDLRTLFRHLILSQTPRSNSTTPTPFGKANSARSISGSSKEGDYRRFKYTPEAWALVQRQPKTTECIFPYVPKSVGDGECGVPTQPGH
jgi:hypothetical protein